jgi:hypothetical protein
MLHTIQHAIIMGHGKAVETIELNQPHWKRILGDLHFISPINDPLPYGERLGTSSHHGPSSLKRTEWCIAKAALLEGVSAIFDYDVLIFSNLWDFPEGGVGSCDTVKNISPKFLSEYHHGNPWVAEQTTWKKISNGPKVSSEGGHNDRWFPLRCAAVGVVIQSAGGYAKVKMGMDKVEIARQKISNGAPCIHGIKSREVFDALSDLIPS